MSDPYWGGLFPDYAEGLADGGGGGGDTTPPTITVLSYPTAPEEPFVLQIQDASPGIEYLGIFCTFASGSQQLVCLRRGVFLPPFDLDSVLDGTASDYEATIYCRGGWPYGTTTFAVDVLDGDGNDEGGA